MSPPTARSILETTPSPLPFLEAPVLDALPDLDEPLVDRAVVPEVVLELAAFACFDFVDSACFEPVRLVPPEFVRFEVPDFSVAARVADARLTLVAVFDLLVAFVAIFVFEPLLADDLELFVVDVAIVLISFPLLIRPANSERYLTRSQFAARSAVVRHVSHRLIPAAR